MLVKLSDLITSDLVVTKEELHDFLLTDNLRVKLNSQLDKNIYFFNKYTSYVITDQRKNDKPANYALIPNQYFLLAFKYYNIAKELIKYFEIFEKIKEYGSLLNGDLDSVLKNINSNTFLNQLFENENDKILFAEFLSSNENTGLKSKKPFNPEGKARSSKDVFASIILNIINLPAVSSSAFGNLVYDLIINPELFEDLLFNYNLSKNNQVILITEPILSKFIFLVINYLHKNTRLNKIIENLNSRVEDEDPVNLNLEFLDKRVTTFFKRSKKQLDLLDLTQGNALRFKREFFKVGEYFYYLTSEWSFKDFRTNFLSFQTIFNSLYPDLSVYKKGTDYVLCRSCNTRDSIPLPKPFLLLAGISGTGKSRFVREQARLSEPTLNNFCMLSVRPDWHEPSDLFGYVSRIPQPHYVVSEFLLFVVKAWKNSVETANSEAIVCKPPAFITPYWLCLDEMNLAPVEQYFADYLSVLETRKWDGDVYSCEPLLKAAAFNQIDHQELKLVLGLDSEVYEGLWDYFINVGIPIPPNLIVAGTVNMDETTHGFSRKVIDRALTIDFGAFFPNQLEEYFEAKTKPIALSFPVLSNVSKSDLDEVKVENAGEETIQFVNGLNKILRGTPFELAYRALNELLISVVCFNPKNELELHAVWDDFLMTKVLPRLEGDSQKLKQETTANNLDNLLTKLKVFVEAQFNTTIQAKRPDLLRLNKVANAAVDEGVQGAENGSERIEIDWRSVSKLTWMNSRLQSNGFTSYWP